MAYFQIMNQTDTVDMQTIFTYINNVVGGLFWPVMLLVIWVIWVLGAVFTGKPIYRAFLFASFMCSIISILMVLMNWLSTNFMYFLFFLTTVGLIWTKMAEAYS